MQNLILSNLIRRQDPGQPNLLSVEASFEATPRSAVPRLTMNYSPLSVGLRLDIFLAAVDISNVAVQPECTVTLSYGMLVGYAHPSDIWQAPVMVRIITRPSMLLCHC